MQLIFFCISLISSPGVILSPMGYLGRSGDNFVCCSWRRGCTGGRWKKSGVLLSILQCTGQPPMIKNHPVPNVQSSFKVEKPLEKLCFDTYGFISKIFKIFYVKNYVICKYLSFLPWMFWRTHLESCQTPLWEWMDCGIIESSYGGILYCSQMNELQKQS